jgi:hypothetical protein
VVALLFLSAVTQPRVPGFDGSWHVLAAAQFGRGESPTPGHVTLVAENDLSTSRPTWISWYAPGIGFLLGPFALAGVPVGLALQVVVAAFVLAGALGWLRWAMLFALPSWFLLLGAFWLPGGLYAGGALREYVAEVMVFGATPWTLLLVHRLLTRPSPALWWLGCGVALGSLYLLKYSASFVGLSVMLLLAWVTLRDRSRWSLERLVATGLGFALLPALLTLVAQQGSGSANLLSAGGLGLPAADSVLIAATGLALVVSGLDFLARGLAEGWGAPYASIALAGIPGMLWFTWSWTQAARSTAAARLALAVALGHVTLFVLASASPNVSVEPRHLLAGGLAILPLALSGALADIRRGGQGRVFGHSVLAVFTLALPWLLTTGFAIQRPAWGALPTSGRNQIGIRSLGGVTPAQVVASVPSQTPQDVWFLADPNAAIDLPLRILLNGTIWFPGPSLPIYRTSQPVTVHAVLPWELEINGSAERVRQSFRGAGPWRTTDIPGCGCQVWSARVEPT